MVKDEQAVWSLKVGGMTVGTASREDWPCFKVAEPFGNGAAATWTVEMVLTAKAKARPAASSPDPEQKQPAKKTAVKSAAAPNKIGSRKHGEKPDGGTQVLKSS
jgi:hypothetical protein